MGPKVLVPARWVSDYAPPEGRGPFAVVHTNHPNLALHILDLLNEDYEGWAATDG